MTEQSKDREPEGTITDPETGEQLKIIKRKGPETWMDKLLRERGIKIREVEPPKDFIRVIIPGLQIPFPDKKEEDL